MNKASHNLIVLYNARPVLSKATLTLLRCGFDIPRQKLGDRRYCPAVTKLPIE